MKHVLALIAATAALASVAVVGSAELARASRLGRTASVSGTLIPGASTITPVGFAATAPREIRVVYPGAASR